MTDLEKRIAELERRVLPLNAYLFSPAGYIREERFPQLRGDLTNQAGTVVVYVNTTMARVYRNANQSIADSTMTDIVYDTELEDASNLHNTTNGRFTIPTTDQINGQWEIFGTVSFAAAAVGFRLVRIMLNGVTAIASFTGTDHGDPVASRIFFHAIVEIATPSTDYVTVAAYQTSGGPLNVVGGVIETWAVWRRVRWST